MTTDPMADAPHNEPIEALFDGEWIEVEWSDSAWDGSPHGTEGWASEGLLVLDLEAWRYAADSDLDPGCPTHGANCPGHLHWEAGAEGGLVRLPSGDVITGAALNAAMIEAGGGRQQRTVVGVDPTGDYPTITAYADGTVSWSEFDGHLGANFGAPSWHGTLQEVRDVVARWLPEPANSVGPITRDDVRAYIVAVLDQAGWSSRDWELDVIARQEWSALAVAPVPELTPPPPVSGCASRGAFLYEGASWELQVWPGYPQDEMLERLNLRWKYGHPPLTPDRARRAGVRP